MKIFFLFFWFLSPNLRAKSVLKENIRIWSKIFTTLRPCRILNASGPGWVSVPPKVFVAPETHYSGAGSVTILFYLQCANYTESRQIILFCPTKCQHFGDAGGWGYEGKAHSRRKQGVVRAEPQRSKILHFLCIGLF